MLLQLSASDEGNSLLELEVRGGNQRTEGVMGMITAVLTPPVEGASSQVFWHMGDMQYDVQTSKKN